jgi:hypothetical protein
LHASLRLPTIRGDVHVNASAGVVKVRLPANTLATVCVLTHEGSDVPRTTVDVDGKAVETRADGQFACVELQATKVWRTVSASGASASLLRSASLTMKSDSGSNPLSSGGGGGGSHNQAASGFLPFGFMSHAVPDVSIDQGANASILVDTVGQVTRGFNLVIPYLSTSTNRTAADARSIMLYLDRCHAVGMRVMYDLTRLVGYSAGRLPALELLAAEVEAVRNHPAVMGWYLADEPDGNNMPVARIAAARQLVRSRSDLPMGMCLDTAGPTGGDQWKKYIDYIDIILVRSFPVRDPRIG